MESTSSTSSSPERKGLESRGSSVSTTLREEYEDLLKYAVVAPNFDGTVNRVPLAPPKTKQGVVVIAQQVPANQTGPSSEQQQVDDEEEETSSSASSTSQVNDEAEQPPATSTNHPLAGMAAFSRPATTQASPLIHQSTQHLDTEMTRLECHLDNWCLDLKRNVLAEFEQSRLSIREQLLADLQGERKRHAIELGRVNGQLDKCRELLVTYEQSITRKDQIIASLNQAIRKQQEKMNLQRSLYQWRLRLMDDKKEELVSKVASQHYRRTLKRRVVSAWFGILQGRWKQRVERACQARAEQVCLKLTNEYKQKLEEASRSLEQAHAEMAQLHRVREVNEESMKKALMRGVCALNMEAMSMFRPPADPFPSHCSNSLHSDRPTDGNQTPPAALENSHRMPPAAPKSMSHDGHVTQSYSHKQTHRKNKGPSVVIERHIPLQ